MNLLLKTKLFLDFSIHKTITISVFTILIISVIVFSCFYLFREINKTKDKNNKKLSENEIKRKNQISCIIVFFTILTSLSLFYLMSVLINQFDLIKTKHIDTTKTFTEIIKIFFNKTSFIISLLNSFVFPIYCFCISFWIISKLKSLDIEIYGNEFKKRKKNFLIVFGVSFIIIICSIIFVSQIINIIDAFSK